jgi:hypothetical protein
MCRSHHAIETRLHEGRKARKKLQMDMKEVNSALYPNMTPSPLGSEERESNPPTLFEQRYANYENLDPSHTFAPYTSTSHMGFDSQLGGDFGQQGPSFEAPPPPEQSRPSMEDEFAASILVPHTPIWLVVPMHLFIILLCRLSLTHHSTSGQERIGLHHMTTSHPMISGIQGLNPLWTPSSSLFDNC